MPPIYNDLSYISNLDPNRHQPQNQPPQFHNLVNAPLGSCSPNDPHSGHANGGDGNHAGPGVEQGENNQLFLFRLDLILNPIFQNNATFTLI